VRGALGDRAFGASPRNGLVPPWRLGPRAGCGRLLEREFMQLDHIQPKAEGGANHILNRILLCGPCNRIKSNRLTLSGLRAENQKRDRMAK